MPRPIRPRRRNVSALVGLVFEYKAGPFRIQVLSGTTVLRCRVLASPNPAAVGSTLQMSEQGIRADLAKGACTRVEG